MLYHEADSKGEAGKFPAFFYIFAGDGANPVGNHSSPLGIPLDSSSHNSLARYLISGARAARTVCSQIVIPLTAIDPSIFCMS